MNKASARNPWIIPQGLILAFFGIFLIYPFFSLFVRAFIGESGNFSFEYFSTFASFPYYFSTLKRSLLVSISTTIIAISIGVPLAYLTVRNKLWGSKLWQIMIIMSLMSPPFIGAYSWIILLGRSGIVTQFLHTIGIEFPSIYGFLGIVIVFSLKLYPYVFLYTAGALNSIDSSLEEAAEGLGASKLERLFKLSFPVITPTIMAGAIMVFMSSLADFGTPMLIGEGYKVLPVLVYEEYMSEVGGNAGMAAALSIIIVICSLSVLLLQKYITNRKHYAMSALRPPVPKELPFARKLIGSAILATVAAITFLPQIVVVITSFKNTSGPIFVDGYGFGSYEKIFYRLGSNIVNTFTYSTISIVCIVVFSVIIARVITKHRGKTGVAMDMLVMFPYVIPGAVLGISLLLAFNKMPLLLAGTPLIMIIAYVIRKMPYTVRSSSAMLQQIDGSVEEAAINLGMSPIRSFFSVTVRIMMPGIISGAILSWISTINELSSSVMLYTGKTSTISVAIYTEVVRASFGTAAALASILTAATILSFILFRILSKGKVSVI